jgi:hypothetical protein
MVSGVKRWNGAFSRIALSIASSAWKARMAFADPELWAGNVLPMRLDMRTARAPGTWSR